jgi:hypothetical protein
MAAKRAKASKQSTNPRTSGRKNPGQSRSGGGRGPTGVPRAHRGDTPEAQDQRRRLPKTHPTPNPTAAARKDAEFKPKRRTSGLRRTARAAQRGEPRED